MEEGDCRGRMKAGGTFAGVVPAVRRPATASQGLCPQWKVLEPRMSKEPCLTKAALPMSGLGLFSCKMRTLLARVTSLHSPLSLPREGILPSVYHLQTDRGASMSRTEKWWGWGDWQGPEDLPPQKCIVGIRLQKSSTTNFLSVT